MTVKRRHLLLVALVVATAVILVPSVAMANFSVHGGYTMDTDACAGCHRAHTSASPLQWTNTSGEATGSALLVGTHDDIEAFCLTCHGTGALGADTNVWDGIFEANDGSDAANDRTYNTAGEALNGGGFNPAAFPTFHYGSYTEWWAYGGGPAGTVEGTYVGVSCTVCHDVHGSVNYRLLKGTVNNVVVGSYLSSTSPQPFVISSEVGYPSGGWLLGANARSQVASYYPDYTTPRYAKPPANDPTKGMNAWCASCHTQYAVTTSLYDANDGFGMTTRHRHPTNVAMSNYQTKLHPSPQLLIDNLPNNALPLLHGAGDAGTQDATDWMDCMTCHVAHGSNAVMTGFANVANSTDIVPDSGNGGVAPGNGNALLRGNNRYVCEECHNK
jgi:predicted CXXCH cytochrome family protein